MLFVGNPARQVGWVSEYGHKLIFNQSMLAICKESGDVYELDQTGVKKQNKV